MKFTLSIRADRGAGLLPGLMHFRIEAIEGRLRRGRLHAQREQHQGQAGGGKDLGFRVSHGGGSLGSPEVASKLQAHFFGQKRTEQLSSRGRWLEIVPRKTIMRPWL